RRLAGPCYFIPSAEGKRNGSLSTKPVARQRLPDMFTTVPRLREEAGVFFRWGLRVENTTSRPEWPARCAGAGPGRKRHGRLLQGIFRSGSNILRLVGCGLGVLESEVVADFPAALVHKDGNRRFLVELVGRWAVGSDGDGERSGQLVGFLEL